MKTKTSLLLIGIFLVLSSLALAQTGAISGRVTDETTGYPIIGAQITLSGMYCGYCVWFTDSSGYYLCDNLPAGHYLVHASASGYVSELYPDSVGVVENDTIENINFALTPSGGTGAISGRVTDEETGLPLPMAHVLAYDSTHCEGDAWTDTAGYYLIQSLVAGQYIVGVHKEGYEDEVYPESVTVEEGQNTPDIDFALTQVGGETGSISGTVTDEVTGYPIAGAGITLNDLECIWFTDSTGYYICDNLPPGLYEVHASAAGYYPETYPESVIVVEGENTPNIDFALTLIGEYGSISGRVTDEETSLPIIMAHLVAIGLDNWCYGEAWSDTSGYYTIQYLCPGIYQVNVNVLGYIPETYPDSVIVVAGENTPDINFALIPMEATGAISGRVTDQETGLPIFGALVQAIGLDNWCYYQTLSDSSGFYIMDSVCVGLFEIRASASGYEPQIYPDSVVVTCGDTTENIDFALTPVSLPQTGCIAGRVTDEITGDPIAFAAITVSGIYCVWYTDSLGYYICDQIPPDYYQVFAYASGYLPESYPESVLVVEGDTTENIDFALAPLGEPGAISGVVYDAYTGAPIGGARIWAYGEQGWGEAFSDSDGAYTISGLYPGDYYLGCRANGYHHQNYPDLVTVNAGETTLGIDFHLIPFAGEKGVIAGRVIEESSQYPITQAIVFALSMNGNFGYSFTDSLGTYIIEEIPVDSYYVYAFAPGYMGEFYDNVYTWGEATLVVPDAYDIDFSLAPCDSGQWMISGSVTSNGSKVADAFVYAKANGEVKGFAKTNPNGKYEINGLSHGIYTITASKVPYQDGAYPDPIEVGSKNVSGIDLNLISPIGDVNYDGSVDLADVILLANYLFKGQYIAHVLLIGDVNCDGCVNLGDVIYLANYLLKSGPAYCAP